ncbi:MAG: hypothetical protein ACREM1_22935 [Longimicrobiales bacterium]
MNALHENRSLSLQRRFVWSPALRTVILAVVLAGCDLDDVLNVEDPEVATPGSVQTPTALPVVFNGVIRDFTYAYSGTGDIGGGGNNDSQIVLTGLLTDELWHTGTFPTRRLIDRRAITTTGANGTTDNGTLSDALRNLHRARRAAEGADALYVDAEQPDDAGRSVVASIAGYTYVLFGEIYCEGVAYSSILPDGSTEFGAPTTRSETFGLAAGHFAAAIEIADAAGDEDARSLALVGLARTLVNEGDLGGAADIAAQVPDDFMYEIFHSDNTLGQENGVFIYAFDSGRYGVADRQGDVGLPFASAGDPRVPVVVAPRDPFDQNLGRDYIAQGKYLDRNAPVVLASGTEARLIRAEAALNDPAQLLVHLNAARAQDGVEPLAANDIPADAEGRVDLLFRERAYSMWLTAHRLGDARRLIRQYGRSEAETFPSGPYFREGLTHGTDVNFPLHVDENNNPNFTGCLNRDA